MAEKRTPIRRATKKEEEAVTNLPLSKEELAKKKVAELLDGVTLVKEEKLAVVDKLEESTKENNVEWLEKQVEGLTAENIKLKEDYAKLFNEFKSSGGMSTGDVAEMKKGIERIFFELDDVYTGAKFGKPFEEAKIRPLLNKIMAVFPFLTESLRRKKTITQLPHGQGQQKFAGSHSVDSFR